MRIALGLEYCGADFHGWQSQPDGRTVQDALEAAIAAIAGEPTPVVCAGRTDAGVHATGQVVHFDTTLERSMYSWVRGANTFLPVAKALGPGAHRTTNDPAAIINHHKIIARPGHL
jgi:tRNA pseudouridine38-40 synthase